MDIKQKVAVITGANAGVGLSLAERLLAEHESIHVCLACRNEGRAENARKRLLRRHPSAEISIVIVDTSSVLSVLNACKEIKRRYTRVDYIYLNAGIMQVSSINWDKVLAIFSSQGAKILSTGEGVLNHVDTVTDEGLQNVFATNLFGHFVMVRELEDHIVNSSTTQIVWTSSQNADSGTLNFKDVQHKQGKEPYSSSKYATDVLSIALNNRLNKKGVYSVLTCPGLVLSNMTLGILPAWIWMMVLPFLYFMRLFVMSLTCNCHNGAEALVWVSKQKPESLNSRIKYRSNCSVLGRPYVGEEKLSIQDEEGDNIYDQLDEMYQGFKQKYKLESMSNGTKVETHGKI